MTTLEQPHLVRDNGDHLPDPPPDDEPGDVAEFRPPPRPALLVRRVRLSSITKIAVPFYSLLYLASLLTLIVVWNIARWTGMLGGLEDAIATATGLESYDIDGVYLLATVAVIGVVVTVVAAAATVLLVALLNRISSLVGGIKVDAIPIRDR